MNTTSAIYEGCVRHRRYHPKTHEFKYNVFMVYLNLSKVDDFLSRSPFWSTAKFALARFNRSDFHGEKTLDLEESVRRTIKKHTGILPSGPICMLANLRYFGFVMNPIVTYYCFDPNGEYVEYIVAEVNNTPWGEKHAYVLTLPKRERVAKDIVFNKEFTVSPFNYMDMQYQWRSGTPGKTLDVHIDCLEDGRTVTDATLRLKRQPSEKINLSKVILLYPFMTVKVMLAIYWQALRLYLKGVPFLGKNKIFRKHAGVNT